MEINVDDDNGISIVGILGKLDTTTSPDAEKKINELLDAGKDKVLIDLKETTYVSSAGLRVFLATSKRLMTTGGSLTICSANDIVQEIFDISGFMSILNIKPSKEEALSEFK